MIILFHILFPQTIVYATSLLDPPSTPVDVYTYVNFVKIHSFDLKTSEVKISAILRAEWTDTRLINTTSTELSTFYCDVDRTVPYMTNSLHQYIWCPDIVLLNQGEPLLNTLIGDEVIFHSSSGKVVWSRLGFIIPICKIRNLRPFPFDNIECDFQLSGWSLPKRFQNILPHYINGGIAFEDHSSQGKSSDLSDSLAKDGDRGVLVGEAFQDYRFKSISVESVDVTFNILPGETWSSLVYTIQLNRASVFYIFKILLPAYAITLITFSVFWISPAVDGIRFALGITAILSLVTLGVIAGQFLPVTNDRLLIDDVLASSMIFAFITMIESTIVYFLFHYHHDSMWHALPICGHHLASKQKMKEQNEHRAMMIRHARELRGTMSLSGVLSPGTPPSLQQVDSVKMNDRDSVLSPQNDDDTNLINTMVMIENNTCVKCQSEKRRKQNNENFTMEEHQVIDRKRRKKEYVTCEHIKSFRRRLQMYRSLFFELDVDFSEALGIEEIRFFGEYMVGEIFWKEIETKLIEKNEDHVDYTLEEFVNICEAEFRPEEDEEYFQIMTKGFLTLMERKKTTVNQKWRYVSDRIDTVSRWLVPLVFFISQVIIFAVNFS